MRFGMLHLFENPIGTSEHAIVKEQLTLMRAAEGYGFDSVWPAEHHFSEYGYCASPAVTLAAIASETTRLRLGTGVVVLPLNHPLRVAEDYAMLHMMSGPLDPDVFWRKGPVEFAARTGTDSRIGRRAWSLMRAAGLLEVRVDYVIVDTLRVPRQVFADIITAWRDGYVDALATPEWPAATVRQHFDEIIASILNPEHYAVWHVPIVSGVKP